MKYLGAIVLILFGITALCVVNAASASKESTAVTVQEPDAPTEPPSEGDLPAPKTEPEDNETYFVNPTATWICADAAVPAGYLVVDYFSADNYPCAKISPGPGIEAFNVKLIDRYTDKPVGSILDVCTLNRAITPPPEWAMETTFGYNGYYVSSSQCGHTLYSTFYNVGRIRRIGGGTPPTHPPKGNLDGISSDGVASGWTFDPDVSSQSIDVGLYVDGPAGSGTFLGGATANLPRPDVNQVFNITGNHGFNFTIPSQFRNGQPHTLYVYSIDATGDGTVLMPGTPRSFTLNPPAVPTGSISAAPNPIQVCDGSGLGVTTLSWSVANVSAVEVRLNAPNGTLFVGSGSSGGQAATGKWVNNGMVFYLQNVSDGRPLTPDNTLATVTVGVTAGGCPTNSPPIARAGGPYVGNTGVAIQFNGSASSDPDGTIASYSWNFGDGTTGLGPTPTHTYSAAGSYTVKLTVADNSGASASASTTANVSTPATTINTWTNLVGVVANSSNGLTKTSTTAGWNAGAVSTKTITGYGYVEFSTGELSTGKICGLSNGSANQNYTEIDYALSLGAGNIVRIYENNTPITNPSNGSLSFGPYAVGDRFRVAVEGGVVRYYKNGTLLYTSANSPNFPLLVDTSLNTHGATITNVVIVSRPTWTNRVGVSVNSNNNLTKTGTTSGWNAGATSAQTLYGDGSLTFSTAESNTGKMCGLSNGNTGSGYAEIDHALALNAARVVRIYENGATIINPSTGTHIFGNYAAGDTFRVAVEGGVVNYYQNGVLIYTSTNRPKFPLRVDTSFNTPGATITGAVISGAWSN
jgi:PKD repeat protein